ncbi:hypothetical protein LP420_30875 [Massilia sp. B-10]|nr:hypothetical protein LP420_30875 [Massilia sp. B-10]
MLDVAALKPRSVSIGDLGLAFFVPGAWREDRSIKALRFHDQGSGMRVEASGFHRPGLALDQWVGMRVAQVEQEMRFLTQAGPSYAISGDGWRDTVSGRAVRIYRHLPGRNSRRPLPGGLHPPRGHRGIDRRARYRRGVRTAARWCNGC